MTMNNSEFNFNTDFDETLDAVEGYAIHPRVPIEEWMLLYPLSHMLINEEN